MHRSASILLSACSLRSSACKQIQRGFRTSCPIHCTASGDGTGNDLTTNPPKPTSFGTCRECGGVLKPAPTLTPTTRYIHCENCNKLYAGNIIEESSKQWSIKNDQRRSPPYPSQIAEYLDRFVVGQKQAKKTLAVGVYQHYRRLEHNIESGAASIHQMKEDVKSTPRGVLYQDENRIGHIATSELRTTPMASAYMQQVPTMPPIPTRRAPPVFRAIPEKEPVKLVQAAGGNAEKAQQGIVFLDEVDKIAAAHEGHSPAYRDVSGEGVQHALLKLVEGTVVNVKSGRKSVGAQQDTVQVDTSDILFVASGAFNSLDKIVARRLDKKSLGFGSSSGELRVSADDPNSEQARKRDYLLSKADQGDLINFGIVPELVGRFPVLVPFHSFDQDMLVRVLTEPQNSLLTQLKLQFAIDNVDLSFSSEALQQVAQLALERKTGARALRSILEGVLLDAKFTVPGSDIESIHVTREAVLGEAEVEYTRRRVEEKVENKQAMSAILDPTPRRCCRICKLSGTRERLLPNYRRKTQATI
ncbi:putative ATP-dependent Clp protease, ATP-binding subunit ClpX [Ancylostoma ceylanicum]|uniref:Putative ATP-dependent Clp protease, ATP-binding subunit ClpX n=1 Tax=Ancylostoma ceylanicum TaxID=53326 RepID=A0A0D6LM04_9BILA|nr:putative ATP-dependent Clp protease, ATP-binding subunit ClpX [Ancylostoma ceylanicum]